MCVYIAHAHFRPYVQPARPVVAEEAPCGPVVPDEVRMRRSARELGVLLTAAKVTHRSERRIILCSLHTCRASLGTWHDSECFGLLAAISASMERGRAKLQGANSAGQTLRI